MQPYFFPGWFALCIGIYIVTNQFYSSGCCMLVLQGEAREVIEGRTCLDSGEVETRLKKQESLLKYV